MIIESIHVQNFLSHSDSDVDFTNAPLWLISGDNGAGKSALFDAIQYSLYGINRVGKTHSNLLIKRGADRATTQIVVVLGGERLRVTCQIDRKAGNRGAEVARWNSEQAEWRPVNVGAGSDAGWNWLATRLPPHELFCSAIYLRQNETAKFLSGSATDRLDRFAKLIDLGRYTELAQRAKRKREELDRNRHDTEVKFDDLGDVSETALDALNDRINELDDQLCAASQAVTDTEKRTSGAKDWQRLEEQHEGLERKREEIEKLLGNQKTILEADGRVRRWDQYSARRADLWRLRDEASAHHDAASMARTESEEAAIERDTIEGELESAETLLEEVSKDLQPVASKNQKDSEYLLEALRLEVDIAKERANLDAAEEAVTEFAGADERLACWQTRDAMLPALEHIAREQGEVLAAVRELREEQDAVEGARDAAKAACQRASEVEHQAEELRAVAKQAADAVVEMERSERSLSDLVERRGQLRGDEAHCPVCDQELDTDAHAHVRAALTGERNRLGNVRAKLVGARQVAQDAADEARRAADEAKRLGTAATEAKGSVQRAEDVVGQAKRALEKARVHLGDATRGLERWPDRSVDLDDIDEEWVRAERDQVQGRLEEARCRATALTNAREEAIEARGKIAGLRQRRDPATQPLGDDCDEDEIRRQLENTADTLRSLAIEVLHLEEEERSLSELTRTLSGKASTLSERERLRTEAAKEDDRKAEDAEFRVKQLEAELAPEWDAVAEDRECYEAEQRAVDNLRPLAAQASDLRDAPGTLTSIRNQLKDNAAEADAIPPDHRIVVDEAEDLEQHARRAEREVDLERGQVDKERHELVQRQEKAARFAAQIGDLVRQALEFAELAELLKDGGPLQTEIAQRLQQQIIDEVNEVLRLLNDHLRVALGDPRRRKSAVQEMQDLVVVDTSDPLNAPCYFEFLSGGEQFRVALALALALHRRVTGDTPGTLMVDEGFGALDTERRDALAMQMVSDSHRGILSLQLAETIVLCSHSSEVQRHFPNRWHVNKRDGTAFVSRVTTEDVLDSVI